MKAIRANNRGFTLIELMIVVVIIGILSMIAYPSYRNYTVKSKRSDAYAALTQAATDQEKFYSQNMYYATSMEALNSLYNDPSTTRMSSEKYYQIFVTNGGTTYTLTATAQGNQASADAKCKDITLKSSGAKGGTSSDCW